jgi:hypothetical protein
MEVKMNLVIMLLILVPSANGQESVDHQRFIAINRQWQTIHDAASREQIPANAFLVIDPREEAIGIERAGQIDPKEIERLPAGLEWSAYHVTQRGVREISFPVRLTRPRLKGEMNKGGESIWVFGRGKDCAWRFSITPESDGHIFHVGSGSGVLSMTVRLPALQGEREEDLLADSILVPDSAHRRKWVDTLRSNQILINVERIPATP